MVSVTDHFLWQDHGFRMLVASFGASAVLLYGVPESKLAQPRNLIGAAAARSYRTHTAVTSSAAETRWPHAAQLRRSMLHIEQVLR